MTQEVPYSNTETEWSKEHSLTDNFPMPGRRQLHSALAVAVLAIILSIVLGYFMFNAMAGSNKTLKKPQKEHIDQ